ncbi:hypothetical protein ADU59_28465 [Pararhizobium polonicum]|uniref:Ketoreductase domain-containing protein n=1 Tax=Pararhizobium polonicum TaxID=1612624 RepID=A0A1C7NT11_9HYPH|nr:SDR family NAD(P)-dependent oxidoreductase [Pararhizobium polonicum]OBZ92138.1 hypothetical protein ADU59_28465 [Pararhizobium polonicum]
MAKFDGKVVVITGGASGIGAASAQAFAAEGARVAILDRTLGGATRETSDTRMHEVCDVCNESAVERAFDLIMERWGAIDIVVHSAAALGGSGPFQDLTLATWKKYIDTNLTGSFLVCRAAARRMIEQGTKGRIILIGSVNSFAAERHAAPYVASKGGVRLLTKAAAVDLAPFEITVNMVAPGPVTTPATEGNFETDATRQVFARVLPGGKPGMPGDIAAAVLFLASPESRFITGTDIIADGGMSAQILN